MAANAEVKVRINSILWLCRSSQRSKFPRLDMKTPTLLRGQTLQGSFGLQGSYLHSSNRDGRRFHHWGQELIESFANQNMRATGRKSMWRRKSRRSLNPYTLTTPNTLIKVHFSNALSLPTIQEVLSPWLSWDTPPLNPSQYYNNNVQRHIRPFHILCEAS